MHTHREGYAYEERDSFGLFLHKDFSLKTVPQPSDQRYSQALTGEVWLIACRHRSTAKHLVKIAATRIASRISAQEPKNKETDEERDSEIDNNLQRNHFVYFQT